METLYQHNNNSIEQIIDLHITNLRKDSSIFIDIWLEKENGGRYYLEYNTQINNHNNTDQTNNILYRVPLKLICLEKNERIRAKSYLDLANSTSSTPSDWSSVSLEDWSNGQPWTALPNQNLDWNEGRWADWVTGFDHWFTYTFAAPLSNILNASVFLTLNIEN